MRLPRRTITRSPTLALSNLKCNCKVKASKTRNLPQKSCSPSGVQQRAFQYYESPMALDKSLETHHVKAIQVLVPRGRKVKRRVLQSETIQRSAQITMKSISMKKTFVTMFQCCLCLAPRLKKISLMAKTVFRSMLNNLRIKTSMQTSSNQTNLLNLALKSIIRHRNQVLSIMRARPGFACLPAQSTSLMWLLWSD